MSWYAVYTKSRAEKKLAGELDKLGISNYLPLKKTERQWSDRKKQVEVPAINCYLFVNIEPTQKEVLFRQPHFVAFVRSFGEAAIIPDDQMDIMRRTVEGIEAFEIVATTILVGQKVKITSSPLEGIEGIITKTGGKGKLYISILTTGLSLVIDSEKITVEPICEID